MTFAFEDLSIDQKSADFADQLTSSDPNSLSAGMSVPFPLFRAQFSRVVKERLDSLDSRIRHNKLLFLKHFDRSATVLRLSKLDSQHCGSPFTG